MKCIALTVYICFMLIRSYHLLKSKLLLSGWQVYTVYAGCGQAMVLFCQLCGSVVKILNS